MKATDKAAVEFDRDEIAEDLATVSAAVLAFRNASTAARRLGDAGKNHGIKPFIEIATNYGLVNTSTPTLSQLESTVVDAECFYPVAEIDLLGKTLTGMIAGEVTGIDGTGDDATVTVKTGKTSASSSWVGYKMKTILALIHTGDVGVE